MADPLDISSKNMNSQNFLEQKNGVIQVASSDGQSKPAGALSENERQQVLGTVQRMVDDETISREKLEIYKNVSIVIPVYNEEESISDVLKRIRAVSRDFEVIVCSDGSTDRTAELAREAGATVLSHPYNIGNGAAIKNGVLHSNRKYILCLDGDLQHPPEDIPRLLAFMPRYDMVVGARTSKSGTHVYRNIGNLILNKVAEDISGHKIADLTSGFRVFKRDIYLKFIHLYPLRYSYPSTITLAFFCSGYFVKYVPLHTITKRRQGQSDIKPLRDGIRFLHIILRLIMTFSPHNIFNPIALLFLAAGLGISAFQLSMSGAIRSSGIILLISSLVIFLNGLLADQLSQLRRDLNK